MVASAILISLLGGYASAPVFSQGIKRIPKKEKDYTIQYMGKITAFKHFSLESLLPKHAYYLSSHLTYNMQGNLKKFSLSFFFRAFDESRNHDGRGYHDSAVYRSSDLKDVVKFVKQLDELYATPLEPNDEYLELTLKWGSVEPIKIAKFKNGYSVWSRGAIRVNADDYRYHEGRGWYKLDLFALRETLARVAREAKLEVPKPSAAMQKELDQVGDKVLRFGKHPLKGNGGSSNNNRPVKESSNKNWTVAEGGTLKGHTMMVSSVAFSPDGRTLASGGDDRKIMLWDIQTGGLQKLIESYHSIAVLSVAISPDGTMLASGGADEAVKLWDPRTGKLNGTLKGHRGMVNTVVFSPLGRTLGSGSSDGTIKLWDPQIGSLIRTLKAGEDVDTFVFSPDGKMLASGGGRYGKKGVVLWDTQTGRRIRTFDVETKAVSFVTFSPDGKTLAVDDNGGITLWDPLTGKLIRTLKTTKSIISAVFSPDGKLLVTGSWDKKILLWDPQTGQLKRTIQKHSDPVLAVAFSPNGEMLASGSWDKTIRLINLATVMSPAQ